MQNDTHNPYTVPAAEISTADDTEYEYAGFWIRLLAVIIDSVLFALVGVPLMFILSLVGLYDFEANYNAFDLIWNFATVIFSVVLWVQYAGTPGKRLLKLKVLDADTGENLSYGKAIIRYLGYIPAGLVFCLGFIWVAFDVKKQGWHDKMANSVVVKEIR